MQIKINIKFKLLIYMKKQRRNIINIHSSIDIFNHTSEMLRKYNQPKTNLNIYRQKSVINTMPIYLIIIKR